jgi:hypothetical protein
MTTKRRVVILFKQIWTVLLFYVAESITTSFFMALVEYLTKPSVNADRIFGYMIGFFGMRILLLQALVEVIMVFIVIHYGGWEKFWLIMFGVFASAIIWGVIIGIVAGNDFSYLKAVLLSSVPLFLGTLVSWWVCYKWIGLKV